MRPIRRLLQRSSRPRAVFAPDVSSPAPRDMFFGMAAGLGSEAQVLEVGTKRSKEAVPTHLMAQFPRVPRGNYTMADVSPGLDVDVVADLHACPEEWSGKFDAIVAAAVFEHLERPWVAAREVARMMKPGGQCYIATHQTFPLHGYPQDFFRFSTEALTLIFADAGLTVLAAAYEQRVALAMPTSLVPRLSLRKWNKVYPSYLCVHLCAAKT